jgi:hypothetical protein
VLCLNDFAAAQAGCADANALGRSFDPGPNRAQVDVPAALGHVVGVADPVTELRPFAANLAYLCHGPLQINSEFDCETSILQEFRRVRQLNESRSIGARHRESPAFSDPTAWCDGRQGKF